MFACPACGAESVSGWNKLRLSPVRSISCCSCGSRLSVPWISYTGVFFAAQLVFWGGVVAGAVVFSASPGAPVSGPLVGGTLACVPALLAHAFLVPLVRKPA